MTKIIDYMNIIPSTQTGTVFCNTLTSDVTEWFTSELAGRVDEYIKSHYYSRYMLYAIDIDLNNPTESLSRVSTFVRPTLQNYSNYFKALIDSLAFDYDPIENYRMTETSTDTDNGSNGSIQQSSSSSTMSTGSRQDTTINDVTSFENNTFTDSNKSTFNSGEQSDSSGTTGSLTINDMNENTHSHTLTRAGNIGVTTSEQMIESYLDLMERYDVIGQIAKVIVDSCSLGCY